jgi:hypothetical protein
MPTTCMRLCVGKGMESDASKKGNRATDVAIRLENLKEVSIEDGSSRTVL